jgi:hypothetical protein
MSIITPTNFNVQSQIHIDTRLTQADITARNLISTPTRYWGMIVHVLDSDGGNNPNTYILQKGTTSIDIFDDGNWIEIQIPTTVSDKDLTSAVTAGDGSTTALTITTTPLGFVSIFVNGNLANLKGDKTGDCYFSADAGATAKVLNAIVATNVLYWNGVIAGYELAVTDRIDLLYN